MPYSETARNEAMDGITVNAVRLHSGDPGVNGTANALGAGTSAATFNAAASGARQMASDVTVTGLAANQPVSWYSAWEGATFKFSEQITVGDTQANAAGQYTLQAASTAMQGNNPA